MDLIGFALSLLIGVSLGFFGGGGSILTVPLLVYVFGLDPKTAIASALLIVAVASVSGAAHHWRRGNLQLRTGLLFGGAGMVGAYLGGRIGSLVDGGVLLLLFAAMMALAALAMWRGRRTPTRTEPTRGDHWKLALQGFTVGSFTGLVGAGGGFLIVPALVLWAGLPVPAAVGTSLLVIVMNCLAGFVGYSSHVSVDLTFIAIVSACAVVGSLAGSRLAHVVAPDSLRRAFAGFVLVMAAIILVREGAQVVAAASAALPTTLPQILFALLMLGVGIAAGRVSRGSGPASSEPAAFERGEGI